MVSRQRAMATAGAQRGLTLIELMVVLSLLGLLATLAAPSMARLIATQRIKATASDLHLALIKARAEALKRNAAVTLQPAAGGWAAGWTLSAGTQSIDVAGAAKGATIETTAASLSYGPTGRLTGNAASSFTIRSSSSGVSAAKCVGVELSGRPYQKDGGC